MKRLIVPQKDTSINNERGQMLLFVVIVLMLLFVIVLAIVKNVSIDVQETQLEQEYETGYAGAEEEIMKISSQGFDTWVNNFEPSDQCYSLSGNSNIPNNIEKFCSLSDFDECCIKTGVGEDGEGDVIVKRKYIYGIKEMNIEKDDVLELDISEASLTTNDKVKISWEGAPAMSIMLVCKDSNGDYYNKRALVCRAGSGTCSTIENQGFSSISDAGNSVQTEAPLLVGQCSDPNEPVLLRFRAIGGQAINVNIDGDGFDIPAQMEEIRAQAFPKGIGEAENTASPEIYTLKMISKRVPALFDYVLFVAEGGVDK